MLLITSIKVNVIIVEMGATWSKKRGGMPENAEKLLFYWSLVSLTNKIKNKGELIGKQQNRQKYAIKFDLEISLLNKMLIF